MKYLVGLALLLLAASCKKHSQPEENNGYVAPVRTYVKCDWIEIK